jgi:hypothetical protein
LRGRLVSIPWFRRLSALLTACLVSQSLAIAYPPNSCAQHSDNLGRYAWGNARHNILNYFLCIQSSHFSLILRTTGEFDFQISDVKSGDHVRRLLRLQASCNTARSDILESISYPWSDKNDAFSSEFCHSHNYHFDKRRVCFTFWF